MRREFTSPSDSESSVIPWHPPQCRGKTLHWPLFDKKWIRQCLRTCGSCNFLAHRGMDANTCWKWRHASASLMPLCQPSLAANPAPLHSISQDFHRFWRWYSAYKWAWWLLHPVARDGLMGKLSLPFSVTLMTTSVAVVGSVIPTHIKGLHSPGTAWALHDVFKFNYLGWLWERKLDNYHLTDEKTEVQN